MIAGVAAGIAESYDWDPVIVRIIFTGLFFTDGFGLVIYLLLWLLIPVKSDQVTSATQKKSSKSKNQSGDANSVKIWLGLALILIGVILLVADVMSLLVWKQLEIGPVLILLAGILLLISNFKK